MIINYKAIEGDTWSSVSYKMYGDTEGINRLIKENSEIPISDYIEAGTIIHVPIIDSELDKELKTPFWK